MTNQGHQHANIYLHGQVQGVGFRNAAKTYAQSLLLNGFAQNLKDGSVYIEVEGPPSDLELFLSCCHSGSNHAQVDVVNHSPGTLVGYTDFSIR